MEHGTDVADATPSPSPKGIARRPAGFGGRASREPAPAPPLLPRPLVRRPRLLALLDSGVDGPVTLVSAAAGAGKTSLLTSWIAEQRGTWVAWVSMERDDDVLRFWTNVLAATRATGAGRASSALRRLAPPKPAGVEQFVRRFAAAIAGLSRPLVVVVDELNLAAREVERSLEQLAWSAPEQLRLVLSTRVDPRMTLGRLRTAGRLTEVRGVDLAFTVDEARRLFSGMQVPLRAAEIEALTERTEGWAVALRLAGLSLRRHPDHEEFVRTFSGNDRAVADFLVEELLSRMPVATQRFLLRTSVCDRLTVELAEALGGKGARAQLDALERENALLVRLPGGWFRYHGLWQGLLLARLATDLPGEAPALRATAARWLAERGHAFEALRQAVAAGNTDLAAEILADVEVGGIIGPEAGPMRALVDRLPQHDLAAHPGAAVAVAASYVADGEPEAALELLRTWSHRPPGARGGPDREVRAAAVGLAAARRIGDVGAALRWARRAGRAGDDDTSRREADRLRAMLLEHRGWARLWSGSLASARRDLAEGVRAAGWIGDDALRLSCLGLLAVAEVLAGNVGASSDLADGALRFAEGAGLTTAPESAPAHLAAAWVADERGEPAAMETSLELAREASRAGDSRDVPLAALEAALSARAHRWRDAAAVGANLVSATRRRGQGDPALAWWMDALAVEEAALAAAAGRESSAERAVVAVGGAARSAAAATVRAELAAGRGDLVVAADDLQAALDGPTEGHGPDEVAAWLRLASLRSLHGDSAEAGEAAERSLDLSAGEGIARPFLLQEGAPDILAERLRDGTAFEDWCHALLGRINSMRPAAPDAGSAEALSEREREVLEFMDTLMSVNEIAAELFVSSNTIKTHVKHIYRKLGVSRRREAVERGRALRILEDAPRAGADPVAAR